MIVCQQLNDMKVCVRKRRDMGRCRKAHRRALLCDRTRARTTGRAGHFREILILTFRIFLLSCFSSDFSLLLATVK